MTNVPNASHNPSDVLIRFSIKTPFWPLSFSYGTFADPSTRMHFVSLDHYIGYRMLARYKDRESVLWAPNGYISYQNLQNILTNSVDSADDPVINPNWERDRDAILDEGVRLKYGQSAFMLDMLMRTGERKIFDVSRDTEPYWCWCTGTGRNQHGKALMQLRDFVRNGGIVTGSGS